MSKRILIRSASIISGATLLSRLIGFARVILMAKVFGTGWIAQAFFVAFRIPNMLRDLAAEGASNAAFVPVFSEYLATKSRKEFWHLVGSVLVAFIAVIICITAAGVIFSPFIVRMIAPGFAETAQQLELTIAMNRVLFTYLILIALAAFCMAVLHSFKSFLAPALFPSVFNLVVIVALLCADNSVAGIWKLVLGTMIAGVLQIAIQLPALLRRGFRFRGNDQNARKTMQDIFRHPGVQKIGRLLLPRVMGTGIYQLNIFIDTIFASLSFLVGQGAIAAIVYATNLIQFPLGIFSTAISSASLPVLSEMAAKNEKKNYAETLTFSLTNILFIMIPAGVGLMVLARPIITILFERGQFDAYSSMITASALSFYAIGLAGYAANKFLALCFNSLQDTVTPVKVSGLALALNFILNIVFVVFFRAKIAGLALASSLSAIIASVILYRLLQKRIGSLDSLFLLRQTKKMILASLAMTVAIAVLWRGAQPFVYMPVLLLLAVVVGIAVYCLVCWKLGVSQTGNLVRWIAKKK